MNNDDIISAESLNKYFYSESKKYFIYIPDDAQKIVFEKDNNYYDRKNNFLKENGFFENNKINFNVEYDKHQVIKNLANLNQLLIEVTDYCNLNCEYCGYGEYYDNHDKRGTLYQDFKNVKILRACLNFLQ